MLGVIEKHSAIISNCAFNLKRSGSRFNTEYLLNPVSKLKQEQQIIFDKFNNTVIKREFFHAIFKVKSYDQQIEELKKAGFPVEVNLNAHK